jgi:transcriptional regulator with XRE-family HTH domain
MANFAERLLELRDTKGLSQDQLAKELRVNTRTYQRYESGEREPKLSTLIAMADFFEVSLDDLAGREGRP